MLGHVAGSLGSALPGTGGGGSLIGDVRFAPTSPGNDWLETGVALDFDANYAENLPSDFGTLVSSAALPPPAGYTGSNYITKFAYGNGIFAGLGTAQGGQIQAVSTSTDGLTYTTRTLPFAPITNLVFFNGYFFYGSSNNNLNRSVDCVTWETVFTKSSMTRLDVINGMLFVVSFNALDTSTTGASGSFTARTAATASGAQYYYFAGLYVCLGNNAQYWTSPNLATWTGRTTGLPQSTTGGQTNTPYIFLVAGDLAAMITNYGYVAITADAINWTGADGNSTNMANITLAHPAVTGAPVGRGSAFIDGTVFVSGTTSLQAYGYWRSKNLREWEFSRPTYSFLPTTMVAVGDYYYGVNTEGSSDVTRGRRSIRPFKIGPSTSKFQGFKSFVKAA